MIIDGFLREAEFRIFSRNRAIELVKPFKIRIHVVRRYQRLTNDNFLARKIKSNRNDWHARLFCDVVKTSFQSFNFFSGSFRCKRKPEFIVVIKQRCNLVNHVFPSLPVDRITTQYPEYPPVRWLKQLTFPQEPHVPESQYT